MLCCIVLVPSSIVIGACVVLRRARKDAAVNDEDDPEERSDDEGGIEMGEMNPLAAEKVATADLRVALAVEAREAREPALRSDSDAASARQE